MMVLIRLSMTLIITYYLINYYDHRGCNVNSYAVIVYLRGKIPARPRKKVPVDSALTAAMVV